MTTIIPGRPVKHDTTKKSYLLNFRNAKEINLFKKYVQCSADLNEDIRVLIIEAMEYYEKKWKA